MCARCNKPEIERSCIICMLGVTSQESERSCVCVFGVTSLESERPCICVLGVTSRNVSGHVYVC